MMDMHAELERSPDALVGMLEELDLTNADLAALCDVALSSVQRWIAGQGPIPMAVIRLCAIMVQVHRAQVICDPRPAHAKRRKQAVPSGNSQEDART